MALEDDFKKGERVVVWIECNGETHVLCTLIPGQTDQFSLGGGVVFGDLDEVAFRHT